MGQDRKQNELNRYNAIAQKNAWSFQDVSLEELPDSTRKYVETFLVHLGVSFKLHKPVIGNTYVFGIDNDLVRFLIHNAASGEHMWGNKDFDNIDNNTALAHLMGSKYGGEEIVHKLFNKIDTAIDRADNFKNN
jgi:hypothetical protein